MIAIYCTIIRRKEPSVANLTDSRFALASQIPSRLNGVQAAPSRMISFWQVARFALVGITNTGIDVLCLNCLLFLYPVRSIDVLIVCNSLAYIVGAVNSFILNKYWTFHDRCAITSGELLRFAVVSAFGIVCNNVLLALCVSTAHPHFVSAVVWTNIAKVFAIGGTAALSFLGMRLWVFADQSFGRAGRKAEIV